MMTSIKKFIKIHPEANELWIYRNSAKASLYATKLLLKTPITANQVTLLGMILGIAGILLITVPNLYFFIFGFFLILLHPFFDFCDGAIARYRNTVSLKGKYWDYLGHFIIHPLMFLGIGIHLFNNSGNTIYILVGALALFFNIMCLANQKIFKLLNYTKKQRKILKTESPLKKKITFKVLVKKIYKSIRYQMNIVLFFPAAKLMVYLLSLFKIKINLVFYLLLFFLIIFMVTFFWQTFIYSKNLASLDGQLKEKPLTDKK